MTKAYLIYKLSYGCSKLENENFHLYTLFLSKCHICNEQGILPGSKEVPVTSKHDNGTIRRFPHCLESDLKHIGDATSNTSIIFRYLFGLKHDKIDDFIVFLFIFMIQLIKVSNYVMTRTYHQSGKSIFYIQPELWMFKVCNRKISPSHTVGLNGNWTDILFHAPINLIAEKLVVIFYIIH